jgi:hypothetical protein
MNLARPAVLLALVAVAVLAVGAVLFRYAFYPAQEATVIWRADRLTGGVELCYSNSGRIQCEPYEPGRPWRQ